MKRTKILFLSTLLTTALTGTVIAAGLTDAAMGVAKDQVVDQTVDTGASMAKDKLKSDPAMADDATKAASDDPKNAATDAMIDSAKDQAANMAVDQGAGIAKSAAKKLIK